MENIISYRDILDMDGKQGGVMPVGILALQKLINTIIDQSNQIKALEQSNKKLVISNSKLEAQTFKIRAISDIDLEGL